MDEEETDCCPLCMEELDITDKTFNACPCGYQVCLWCWHQIKNEYNGLCPACRQPYAELSKQKNPLDREDVVRRTKQRKQKEKSERRSASASQQKPPPVNRKNLANVRVMQRNLVYVIGLPVHFADENILRSNEGFGQYGKIVKAVVNKAHLNSDRANATASAYITYANKEDALCCIVAIDGYYLDGSMLRASFGTTKYCNFFLRNLQCNNSDCLYLHELGEQDDSFTKEEMQSALHSGKAAFRDMSLASGQSEERAGSRFPPPHRPQATPRSSSASRSSTPQRSRSSASTSVAPARAHTPLASATAGGQSDEEQYADTQRQAQSAAAISKLRQSADANASKSLSPDRVPGAARSVSRSPNGTPYSKVVGRQPNSSSSSYASAAGGTANELPDNAIEHKKPQLRVDTSREKETPSDATETVVGPLEALKLATGSSIQEPAWAQPFPSASVAPSERDDSSSATSSAPGVYSPFGLGFEGGIHRASSTPHANKTEQQDADSVWGASSAATSSRDGFLQAAASTPLASASSSSSFASIDAIFSQRNESSEALAGMLGVQLSSTPLSHGTPLAPPPKDARTSRFAFANPMEMSQPGMQQTTARYELLDGTNVHNHNRSSFGNTYDGVAGTASPASSSSFPSTPDRSGFPPLGSSQQQQQRPFHHAPSPHAPRNSFGSDFGGNELPLSGGMNSMDGTAGTSSGLAFLQQMLPNVNISFGGDYGGMSGAGLSSGVGTSTTPSRSTSTGRGRSPGRRLFERSQSAGSSTPDVWDDAASLGSLGFDTPTQPSTLNRRASSVAPSFYDPALAPQVSTSFSSSFYGFGAEASTRTNGGDGDGLGLRGDFGGETYRHSGSLVNNR